MNILEQRIADIVYDTLQLKIKNDHIKSNITMKNLGITSMETVSLMVEFEEAFEIEIETEEMFALSSIKDVIFCINMKINERQAV